jgi:hypothetical protein
MDEAAWREAVLALGARDVEACVAAAAKLQAEATLEDVPRLLGLLVEGDFFAREAAAWPLAELAGPAVLPQLFAAYQRGFDEGHDNDGFTAALLEIPSLHPSEAKAALAALAQVSDGTTRGHAEWLLQFCEDTQQKQ